MPIAYLFEFLLSESLDYRDNKLYLVEICIIDIQRRWSAWKDQTFLHHEVGEIQDEFERLPRIADYTSLAQKIGIRFTDDEIRELTDSEFRSRQICGDLPKPSNCSPRVSGLPAKRLKRPRVKILESNSEIFRTEVWGRLIVGRQARGEPDFPALFTECEPEKVICADGLDSTISRNQFTSTLLSRRYVVIKNISSNRSFIIVSDAGELKIILAPERQAVVRIPFCVVLGTTKIQFQRPA